MKKMTDFLKRVRFISYIDPGRDWIMLITVSVITLAGIVVWNAWAFDTVVGGGVIGSPATTTQLSFNQASLDAIHAIFDKRATEEAKYVSGVYRFADPSQ